MENLIISLNCVIPIFCYMLVGCFAKWRKIVPDEVHSRISHLAFAVLLPFAMFANIYSADLSGAFSPKLLAYMLGGNTVLFLLSMVYCFRAVPDRRRRGLYIQNVYRSNIVIIGLVLAQSLMGSESLAAMSIVATFLVPLYNAFAIIALELCRGGQVHVKELCVSICKNPLIVGAAAGILFVVLGIDLPQSVESAISELGSTASVITMVALGATFEFRSLKSNAKLLTLLTVIRLIAAPAVLIFGAMALGFRGDELAIVMLCAASPIATSVYPMALVYDSDDALSGQVVVTTSFFCCFTLFLWIFALKQFGLI